MKILQVLTRRYLPPDALESTIEFYEELFTTKCQLRFSYPAAQLELAQVGALLLIAGSEQALAPFVTTDATFIVDDLAAWQTKLAELGATIVAEPKAVPTGYNMRVRHPDGLLVEYVELQPK